jgi:hypothetical protein
MTPFGLAQALEAADHQADDRVTEAVLNAMRTRFPRAARQFAEWMTGRDRAVRAAAAYRAQAAKKWTEMPWADYWPEVEELGRVRAASADASREYRLLRTLWLIAAAPPQRAAS